MPSPSFQFLHMTAAEIIEQIQELSPEEQRLVCKFVLEHFGTDEHSSNKPPTHEPIESIGGRIFERYPALFKKLAE
jgi:hypothetical protein